MWFKQGQIEVECGDENGYGSGDKTSYISELTTTHLVKQDDVGMTVVTGIDTDIGHGDLLS